ncbi:MAG TPA: transcription termination factor NusA [Ktedonobacterales bacterium]|nr:transcription termination factor NusA [Ktedonobacterales bacterium]
MRSEFQAAISQLTSEKKLPQDVVMETVAKALLAAYQKSTGRGNNVRIEVDKRGDIRIWAAKKVVALVSDPNEEISLGEAQQLNPKAALGELLDVESPAIFNRIPAQTAKQVILQRIREAEQEYLYESLKDKLDDLVMGTIVRRSDKDQGAYILDITNAEATLEAREQVPGEKYRLGQRLRVYVYDIRKSPGRGLQVMVSRTHRNVVKRLFELEVPEIFDGYVEIKAIAREPGSRSKVAVWARQEGLDPIGSCVGVRGSRINNIVNELNGEKIDIIQWDPEPEKFVANALSPVKPLEVELRESDHTALVTVAEKQLSLAIGKDGQNARLAARLTGWRVDVLKPDEEPPEERVRPVKERPAKPAFGLEDLFGGAAEVDFDQDSESDTDESDAPSAS